MSRRVATITLNPAYDLVGFTPEIERGEVNLVRTTGLHAAGKGINPGLTKRVIRQVDFAPTVAVIGGVRMPRECEGAPIYQILEKNY